MNNRTTEFVIPVGFTLFSSAILAVMLWDISREPMMLAVLGLIAVLVVAFVWPMIRGGR